MKKYFITELDARTMEELGKFNYKINVIPNYFENIYISYQQ